MVSDGASERDEPGEGSIGGVKRGGGVTDILPGRVTNPLSHRPQAEGGSERQIQSLQINECMMMEDEYG